MSSANKNIAHTLETKRRTTDIEISEKLDFSSLFLPNVLLAGLQSSGFVRPSPIQLKAIPLGRCGLDLIVQAKSGTGKTCVFAVVALDGLNVDALTPQVLVLAPTREIALQIYDVFLAIGSCMAALRCQTFIGGMPFQEDKQKIKNCHVVIGTPGRVKQLIEHGLFKSDSIRLFVLDEADKLLEESFQKQVNWIYSALPENKQIVALSATYPEYLAQHLTAYMRDPTFVRLNCNDPALLGIKQFYQTVGHHPLPNQVFDMKSAALIDLLSRVRFQQCLVFSNYQTRALDLSNLLNSRGWPSVHIAGKHDQRARNEAMHKLKSFKCRILISTDLTARGIDCDKVNLVVNLDLPPDHETYLHRIGRAGRFGSFGAAVSLVSEGKEYNDMKTVEQRCNTKIQPLPNPIPSTLTECSEPVYLDDLVSSEKLITRQHTTGPAHVVPNGHDDSVDDGRHGNGRHGDVADLLGNGIRQISLSDERVNGRIEEVADGSDNVPKESSEIGTNGNGIRITHNGTTDVDFNLNNSALVDQELESFDMEKVQSGRRSQLDVQHSTPTQVPRDQGEPAIDFSTPKEFGESRDLTESSDSFLNDSAAHDTFGSIVGDSTIIGDEVDPGSQSDFESFVLGEKVDPGPRSDSESSDLTDYGIWLDEEIPLEIPNLIKSDEVEYTDYVANRDEVERLLETERSDDVIVGDVDENMNDVIEIDVPKCSNQLLKSVSKYVENLAMSRMANLQIHSNIFDESLTFCEAPEKNGSLSDDVIIVTSPKEETERVICAPKHEVPKEREEEGIRIRKPKNLEQRSTATFLAAIRENASKAKKNAQEIKTNPVSSSGSHDVTKGTEDGAAAMTSRAKSDLSQKSKDAGESSNLNSAVKKKTRSNDGRGRHSSLAGGGPVSIAPTDPVSLGIRSFSNASEIEDASEFLYVGDACYRSEDVKSEHESGSGISGSESERCDSEDDGADESSTSGDVIDDVTGHTGDVIDRDVGRFRNDDDPDNGAQPLTKNAENTENTENTEYNDNVYYPEDDYDPEYYETGECTGNDYYDNSAYCDTHPDEQYGAHGGHDQESHYGGREYQVPRFQADSSSPQFDWSRNATNQQASHVPYRQEQSTNQSEAFYDSYFYWYDAYMESVNYWRNYRHWYRQYTIGRRNDVMRDAMARAQERVSGDFPLPFREKRE